MAFTSMTDADLFAIRAEVGSAPADDVLDGLWDDLQDATGVQTVWQAVAVQVLAQRLADFTGGTSSVNIAGAIAVSTSMGDVAYLRAQIQRLTAQVSGVGAGGRITAPSHRSILDRPVFPPRV